MNLGIVATVVVTALVGGIAIGITIGTMIVKNGLFETARYDILKWNSSRKSPQRHCPHVRVKRQDGADPAVLPDYESRNGPSWNGGEDGLMECRRCGDLIAKYRYPSWLARNLPLWEAQPDKAEKQIRKAKRIALRHPGGTGLNLDDD